MSEKRQSGQAINVRKRQSGQAINIPYITKQHKMDKKHPFYN
jgi:hypothetical protein